MSKHYQYMYRSKRRGSRRSEKTKDLPELGGATLACVLSYVLFLGYVVLVADVSFVFGSPLLGSVFV